MVNGALLNVWGEICLIRLLTLILLLCGSVSVYAQGWSYAGGQGTGLDFTPGTVALYEIRYTQQDRGFALFQSVYYTNASEFQYYGLGGGYIKPLANTFGVEATVTVGYLNHPERTKYLTRNRQFNLGLKFYAHCLDTSTIFITWNHTSNAAKILFNGRRKYRPNSGLDYLITGVIWGF